MSNMARPRYTGLQAAPAAPGGAAGALLTVTDVSGQLAADEYLVRRAYARGALPGMTVGNGEPRFRQEDVTAWAGRGLPGLRPSFPVPTAWPDNPGDYAAFQLLREKLPGHQAHLAPGPKQVQKMVDFAKKERLEFDIKVGMDQRIADLLSNPAPMVKIEGVDPPSWAVAAGRSALRDAAQSEIKYSPKTSGNSSLWDQLYASPAEYTRITNAAFDTVARGLELSNSYFDVQVENGNRLETRQAKVTLLLPWREILSPKSREWWIDLAF